MTTERERLLAAADAVLEASGPRQIPAGLAATAAAAALAHTRQPSFIDRLIGVAWRGAAVATVAAVLLLLLFGQTTELDDGDDATELYEVAADDSFDPTSALLGEP